MTPVAVVLAVLLGVAVLLLILVAIAACACAEKAWTLSTELLTVRAALSAERFAGRGCPAPRDSDDDLHPVVCPGCHSIGGEDCAPGCIDDEMRREREDAYLRGPSDCDDVDLEYDVDVDVCVNEDRP